MRRRPHPRHPRRRLPNPEHPITLTPTKGRVAVKVAGELKDHVAFYPERVDSIEHTGG